MGGAGADRVRRQEAEGRDRGDLELGTEEEKKEKEEQKKETQEQYKELLEFIKGKLEDSVKEVRFSGRLTDSACCLVADEYGHERQHGADSQGDEPGCPRSRSGSWN